MPTETFRTRLPNGFVVETTGTNSSRLGTEHRTKVRALLEDYLCGTFVAPHEGDGWTQERHDRFFADASASARPTVARMQVARLLSGYWTGDVAPRRFMVALYSAYREQREARIEAARAARRISERAATARAHRATAESAELSELREAARRAAIKRPTDTIIVGGSQYVDGRGLWGDIPRRP